MTDGVVPTAVPIFQCRLAIYILFSNYVVVPGTPEVCSIFAFISVTCLFVVYIVGCLSATASCLKVYSFLLFLSSSPLDWRRWYPSNE